MPFLLLFHQFPLISAKDHDISPVNQNLTYQLLGQGSDKFILDPLTAAIELRRPWSIDCEEQCEYFLKVSVSFIHSLVDVPILTG